MQSDGAAPHPILNMTNVHMSIDAEERRPDAAAGNRTTKTALQQADPTPVSALSEFSYDNIYQLTQTLVDQSLAESYTYDAVGNRLTSVSPASYTYNASNQLTATSAATYTYDYNGNTLSKTDTNGTTYYAWDYENRLTQVMLPGTGGTAYFNYDPFGRRIRKVFGSATTIYAYDGDNVIEELDASGSVTARYTQGAGIDEPLAMCRGLTTTYFHADGLGSITSLTDGVGQLAASYVYDSFGKLTASTGTITNPFQYTGREFDSETGLYYYRTRYYDPGVGRFLTEDPAGFLSGSIDFYAYVENSPVSFNDPNGLQARGEAPCCTEKFNDALAQVQKALSGPNAAQSAVFNKYKPCFQKLGGDVRVKCGPPLETKSGFVNCGYHDPRIPSVIRVTPMASRSSGGCGPLKATIVHEMVHICYENDVFGPPLSPTEQEKEAFGIECQLWGIDCACARNPKKCGY